MGSARSRRFGLSVASLVAGLVRCFVAVLLRCLLGCLVAWLLGCLVAWLLGCLGAWLLGCLVAWLLGCLVAWLLGWFVCLLVLPHAVRVCRVGIGSCSSARASHRLLWWKLAFPSTPVCAFF